MIQLLIDFNNPSSGYTSSLCQPKLILLHSWVCNLLPPANEVCEGYVFTRVCHSVHGGSASVHAGITPHQSRHPQEAEQTPPEAGTPPGADTPCPQEQTPPPPEADTLPEQTPPPSSACWEIRPTSGRYASYWNAFLFWYFCASIRSFTNDWLSVDLVIQPLIKCFTFWIFRYFWASCVTFW